MKKESKQKIMDSVLKWIGVFMLLKDFVEQIVKYIGYLMNILDFPRPTIVVYNGQVLPSEEVN